MTGRCQVIDAPTPRMGSEFLPNDLPGIRVLTHVQYWLNRARFTVALTQRPDDGSSHANREVHMLQWPAPRQPQIALVGDLTVHADVLAIVAAQPDATVALVNRELAPRLRASRQVERYGPATVRGVLEELSHYGWLSSRIADVGGKRQRVYSISDTGTSAERMAAEGSRLFLRLFADRMQAAYTIPGWFVDRLWKINPTSGEVILPAPVPDWEASSAARDAGVWCRELEQLTEESAHAARRASPSAFPVTDQDWVRAVTEAWEHVKGRKRRTKSAALDNFAWTRAGLALAMRIAALRLLFCGTPYGHTTPDIPIERPLAVKTLKPWCPRLQTFEMIGYTDSLPEVSGRLLYPTSVFRESAPGDQYTRVETICHPDGRSLYIHLPAWEGVRERFWQILIAAYQGVTKRVLSRYVSLLDVRDEVCRQLRLSTLAFDEHFARLLEEPLLACSWQVSIETDVREGQQAGGQAERRPVYVNNTPYTLIALGRLPVSNPRTA